MPFQLNRSALFVRLVAICSALIVVTQALTGPVAATPAQQDGEMTAAPDADAEAVATEDEGSPAVEDEAAVEPVESTVEGADEERTEPTEELAEAPEEPAQAEAQAEAEPVLEEVVEVAAEPAEAEEASAPPVAEAAEEEAAAPVAFDDPVDDQFLRRLLDAINERRAQAGTQRLAYIPARANAALDPFLAETVPAIRWPGPCGHNLIDGAFSWDYISATGFGGAPRGEVLACPGPEPYWTPDRAAEQWWESPIHHDVLYADSGANAIACSAYGVGNNANGKRKGKTADAASAVLCVTFRG